MSKCCDGKLLDAIDEGKWSSLSSLLRRIWKGAAHVASLTALLTNPVSSHDEKQAESGPHPTGQATEATEDGEQKEERKRQGETIDPQRPQKVKKEDAAATATAVWHSAWWRA